ncbi:MAG: hypothetical protein Q4D02_08215 [Clostridia bacterium]|nr:hypothetical protein [Clostridia bacterium]
MNPFLEKPKKIDDTIMNFKEMYPKSYNKCDVSPYTKTRIILMNGTEVEAVFFSHNFQRHCNNNDLRRELALTRRIEQQQQKLLINLKPIEENILEQTIGYEQLAVDLTARLAKMEPDTNVRNALNFALLEDFDHLYRYSDLLELEYGILPEKLVGCYTEIMPGRPTIAQHRYPFDSVKQATNFKDAELSTKLHTMIITAAEQQTMNYYMNVGSFYTSEIGRKLFQEIGMIEEQHVSQYGSLIDPTATWLEMLLMHEYTECYLYYSCFMDETDPYVKCIFECFFEKEVAHLHKAVELLQKYEGKDYTSVIPDGEFPELLTLGPNIEYVRDILSQTVNNTANLEGYIPVEQLPKDASFFKYQNIVTNCNDICIVPSHLIIDKYINKNCMDYRFEICSNPIPALQNRCEDNTTVGRV